MSGEVELLVSGQRYGGWKSVTISRSIETIANEFELSVTDTWAIGGKPWPIREGNECTVLLDGKPVVTGFVDDAELEFSKSSHRITVKGRDKTGKLVDNSCDVGAWQFQRTPILALLEKVCGQFGIAVVPDPDVLLSLPKAPQEALSLDPGDKAFEAIDRICKFAGVLPVADGLGNLRLVRPGKTMAPIALVQGQNVLSGSSSFSTAERYHLYKVLGQSWNPDGDAPTKIVGRATDPGVSQTDRVLIIQAERPMTQAQADARAKWEASTRAARSDVVSVTVQGWSANGYVWTPGDGVVVTLPALRASGSMMITGTRMTLDSGKKTEISLGRPDAFAPELNPIEAWKK